MRKRSRLWRPTSLSLTRQICEPSKLKRRRVISTPRGRRFSYSKLSNGLRPRSRRKPIRHLQMESKRPLRLQRLLSETSPRRILCIIRNKRKQLVPKMKRRTSPRSDPFQSQLTLIWPKELLKPRKRRATFKCNCKGISGRI